MKRLSYFLLMLILAPVVHAQSYLGRSPDADWRAEAQERIEKHRMGAFRVVVVEDDGGEPVEGASVSVTMQQQAFGFGTEISPGLLNDSNRPTYRSKINDLTGDGRTFNYAVFGNAMKWPNWESSSRTGKNQRMNDILFLLSRGMTMRGHNLLWPGHLPTDVANSSDPALVRQRIQDHITSMPTYRNAGIALSDLVDEWDVLNEPVHNTGLRDLMENYEEYESGEDIYVEAFEWANEADPDAQLFVNEYNILNGSSSERTAYKGVIQNLIDAGAPIGGIGMQGHMSTTSLTGIPQVYDILEGFTRFDMPISVTEFDVPRRGDQDANPQLAADYTRDFLTIIYSHPLVESFVMWGFWDQAQWRDEAVLFDEDWSLKPSGQAFMDLLLDEWWTDKEGTTSATGTWTTSGYLGSYEVAATVNGEKVSQEVELDDASDTTEVVLQVTSTAAEEVTDARSFRLGGNHPNPFHARTTLRYTLSTPAEVTLEVYDVMGRRVRTVSVGRQTVGEHGIELAAERMPTGVYFYRLRAGERSHTGRMTLAR